MDEEYISSLRVPPQPADESPYASLAADLAAAPVLSPAEQQARDNRALAQASSGLGEMDDATLDQVHNMFGDRVSHPIKAQYRNETVNADFRGRPEIWNNGLARGITGPLPEGERRESYSKVRTRYFDGSEQAAATLGIRDGLIMGADGKAVDTGAASGFGTAGMEAEGKHIFAMSEHGELRGADAWKSRRETRGDVPADPTLSAPVELDMVNHSSLLAGERAAAAGELRVAGGKLQQVSDQSGHYHPDSRNVFQALEHFRGGGVDMHDVEAKMVGKKERERPLIASAREVLEHGGGTDAEAAMRGLRARLTGDLADGVAMHRSRQGIDMSAGEPQAAWNESRDPRRGRGPRVGRPAWEASAVGTDRRGRVSALTNLFQHWGE